MGAVVLARYSGYLLRYRWLVVGIAIAVMLAVSAGAVFVGTTNDYRSMFDEGDPNFTAFLDFEDTYGPANSALIAIAPRNGSVFSGSALSVVEELTEAAWYTPYATRVDSLTNYTHSWADGDELIVQPLVENASELEDADLEAVEKTALGATDIAGRLVARDGRVAGLVINFTLPEDADAAVLEITNHLHGLLDEFRDRYPDIAYYLSGDIPLHRAFAETTQTDFETLAPIMFLITVVVAAVLLRSAFGTLAITAVLICVVNSTVGFAGWIGTVFNPVNSGTPIIVMTVAIAHSVHIVETTLAGMRQGMDRNTAISESIRVNMWPVTLTSLTTIIGFLSLNASDSPPFRVLGNLVAFGVVCAFVYSIAFLPALLSILPMRVRTAAVERPALLDRFGAFIVARRTIVLWGSVLVTVLLCTGIYRLEFTDNWTKYFSDRYPFRQATDFIIENLTGMETLEYSLSASRDGAITDPEYLREIEAFAEWYREQPEVSHVQVFSDILKRLNKNMNGDNPDFYQIPDDSDLAAQYLLIYELSLPYGRDLANRIDVSRTSTRMTVVLRSLTSQQQLELDARAQSWLSANSPMLAGSEATGVSIVFSHLFQSNIRSILTGTIIAMGLISLILIFAFRSMRIGFLSLLPNFIPAALSFGLWGYLVGRVGLAGSVMTAIAFGIIVDDTIHFLSHYLKARNQGANSAESVRTVFRTVGHALWTTTAMLTLGFLVFASSGFEISWSLGLLVSFTVCFAFIADVTLLPALLMTFDRTKSRPAAAQPEQH